MKKIDIRNDSASTRQDKHLNRRKLIQAFGLAALTTSAGTAFSMAKAKVPEIKKVYNTYGTIDEMKRDATIKEGMLLCTMGYHTIEDRGGAEFIVKSSKSDEEGTVAISNNLYASLVNVRSVNYKMFGTVSDGKNDDAVQIKMAHAYANRMDIPVINHKGEYWLKATFGIEIQTNVEWGDSIFHLDEKFNTRRNPASDMNNRFMVTEREKPVTINFDAATKAKILSVVKPGVTIIPEFAPYKNSLIVISDTNDRIGARSGTAGSTKAREEFFYIEEHGRVLGDVAWSLSDYTTLIAYPASNSYLVIEGGTFYASGENPTIGGSSYVQMGFSIGRSRTIIRNQWVGLEKGKADMAMVPRWGFYSYYYVYDVLLENVTLIPWEKNREGTDKDVSNGTYGLGGRYALNATFRNVTAEGSPVHWGIFGTNLFKNFRVEQCMLNRIDVHFYCWNLYIKDCKVGTNGITITGGGDLFIENTTCRGNSFVGFRRDYGGKWDGDIRIRNCKHSPTGAGETALLSMGADDMDYKYPVGYGRTIKVEDIVVDFSTVPTSRGASWLMKLSTYSQAAYGGRVFFPSHIEFRNIVVEGREQGMRLLQIPDPQTFKLPKPGSYDGVQLNANCKMIFEDIHLEKLTEQDPQSVEQLHLVMINKNNTPYKDAYALYPEIRVARCNEFAAHIGGNIVELLIEQCKVTRLTGNDNGPMRGAFTFNNCKFEPVVKNNGKPFYLLGAELGTSFINCIVFAPRVGNISQPELVDQVGFIQINKAVHYNHINTRLGNDIINYYKSKGLKINSNFIAMLKSHHEMETPIV